MPEADSGRAGFQHTSQFVAGRAVACGSQVVVPVLRIGVQIAGADGSPGSGFGGSCSTDLLGAFIGGADGRIQWLPAAPSPPGDTKEWSEWLADQPELQREIERAVSMSGAER